VAHRVLQGLALVAALASASVLAQAPEMLRGGRYELSGSPIFTAGKTYNFANGARSKTDVGVGLAFQWAYNFNDHFAAGFDFAFSGADYVGTASPDAGNPNAALTFDTRIETSTVRLAGTYNFLASQFTPFVSAGLGVTWIDTNIPTGPAVPVCWWYPYYGQVCSSAVPTRVQTEFSYNAGIGLRYDLRPEPYFFRAAYNRAWIEFGGNTGSVAYDQYRIDFGVRF
jgi:opacity protein-like surface antigen